MEVFGKKWSIAMERKNDEGLVAKEYEFTNKAIPSKWQQLDVEIISKISNLSIAEINCLLKQI